jgi:hypothetical protein
MNSAWLLAFASLVACGGGGPIGADPGEAGGSSAASGKGGGTPGGSGGASGKGSGGGNAGGTKGGSGGSSSGAGGDSGSGAGGSGGTGLPPATNCTTQNLGSPTLRLLTRGEFDSTINDIFPAIAGKWSDTLPANSVSTYGFDNDSGTVVGNQQASALLDTALSIGAAVTGSDLQNLLPCAASSKDRACAQTFVEKFGLRLFRRPVTDTEKARYLTLFDTALATADFPTALKWVTAGLVQSPNAVYRSEIGTVAGNARKLNPYEVATELAYTFSGSTPDEALLKKAADAAEAGGDFPDAAATAATLLKSADGQAVMQHFFAGYLAYTGVTSVVKANLQGAPSQFSAVSSDMVKETQSFISNVLLNGGGTFADLLTSNKTYPTAALAAFYGSDPSNNGSFPMPGGDGSITRPAGKGLGILAQGSFLASHANTDASSPTQRGLFVYYRLLCQPKLEPPKNVPPLSSAPTANTTRERYELAHAQPGSSCAGCHAFFDPIGFGFEAFDAAGRFRTQQGGEDIDAAAWVPDADGNKGVAFNNQEELVQALAAQPETAQCFAAYLGTYAFGTAEACIGLDSTASASLNDGSTSIVDAFAALAAQPHFTQRKPQ